MPPSTEPLSARVQGTRVHGTLTGKGEPTVLLVHGLLAESREFGALPAAIADAGLSALAVDLRGHGKSDGPRGIVSRDNVLEDILAWKFQLSEHGRRLVAVVGHSLGGTWALAAAGAIELRAVGAIASPATIRGEIGMAEYAGYRVGAAVHKLASRLGKRDLWVPYKVGPKDVLNDPEAIQRMEEAGLLGGRVPLALVEPLLRVDAEAWARQASCPGLIGIAKDDRVVSHEATRRIYEAYAGPKTWVELPGGHSCFFDAQRAEASKVVASWLADTLDA